MLPLMRFAGLCIALLLSGCAQYEFRVVEPAALARTIPPKQQTAVVQVAPLDYYFANLGGRLGVRIANPTDTPAEIQADKSYAVDPRGLSHPLGGATVAPHSYLDLFLPPYPAVYQVGPYYDYPYGPYYGGFYGGWGYGYHHYGRGFFYEPYYYPMPTYYTYRTYTPYDWDWTPGTARVRLTYKHGAQLVEHDFVFARVKIK